MNTTASRVYLMYHEIELRGRSMCHTDSGYVRYVVGEADFRNHLHVLRDSGSRGISVGQALADVESPGIAITFDDGCETDLIAAAPLLDELGFQATFYVTVGFLGTRGYLSRTQLRELGDLGFEIGSHSMSHPYLTDLNEEQLKAEIAGSKWEIEQITGRPVHHFSCPGGRWDQQVAEVAQRAGYRSVATSWARANSRNSNTFALGRVAILRGTNLAGFRALAEGRNLWKLRLQDSSRTFAKRLLGNSLYDRVRSGLLPGQR